MWGWGNPKGLTGRFETVEECKLPRGQAYTDNQAVTVPEILIKIHFNLCNRLQVLLSPNFRVENETQVHVLKFSF